MMISPETYYEMNLKDRTAKQIKTEIRNLKKEMERLKDIMENPDYNQSVPGKPNEATQLFYTRQYLERAKQALAEAGEQYVPSKEEIKASDFDANIPYISTIKLSIGGFFSGNEYYTITLTDGTVQRSKKHSFMSDSDADSDIAPSLMSAEDFLSEVKELHIGEWREDYDTMRFGYVVCDGTQWELEISYSNGHGPVSFTGSNAYPYNFDELMLLFGINSSI